MKMILLAFALCFPASAHAQVTADKAWVRGTVPGQTATGAFMQLKSAQDTRLVGARSAAAGAVEIHSMTSEGGVMKMRPVTAVDLPAGKPVELKPGGFHMMLLDLKKTVKEGDSVPITLVLEGKDGKRRNLEGSFFIKLARRS